jgi:hypothetical protein
MSSQLEQLLAELQQQDMEEEKLVPSIPEKNIKIDEPQQEVEGYKEIIYDPFPEKTFTGKGNLTELANDEEFSQRAARFLEGIGSNENIFEYLRDSDYSLTSAIGRSFEVDYWTDEQKSDYIYLREQFDNTDLEGFRERFGAFKDISIDIIADPLNLVTALFALPSGGASAAMTTAAKAGTSKLIKSKLQDKVKSVVKDEAFKKGVLYGSAEGLAWGGLHNYFLQDIDMDLGLKEEIDLTDIGTSAVIGAGFTGALVGGSKYMTTKFSKAKETNENMPTVLQEKEYLYSNEDHIRKAGEAEVRKELVEEYKTNEVIESKDNITNKATEAVNEEKNRINRWLANTIGKPVTEFVGFVKRAPSLKNILASIRYDYATGLAKGQKGVTEITLTDGSTTTRTFGEGLGQTNGFYLTGLAKAFNLLYRVGFRAKIFGEQNDQLAYLLRDNNLLIKTKDNRNVTGEVISDFNPSDYKVTTRDGQDILGTNYEGYKVSEDIISSYLQVKQLLNKAYIDGKAANIFKEGTTQVVNYLPRVFKHSVLEKKRDIFEQKLIDAGHADPINEKQFKQFFKVDPKTGETILEERIKGVEINALGQDELVFGVDFVKQAKGDVAYAKQLKAKRIVDDMLSHRYTPAEFRIAGKKSDASGFMQPRVFRNLADNDIAEFLENDVQNLLENYFTNFSQSLNRAKYFGRTLSEIRANKIDPLIKELRESGMSMDEASKVGEKVFTMIEKVSGLETYADSWWRTNKFGRNFADWGKLAQQMAHLPFATLSSVTEPLLLLSRAGKRDAPAVIADIGKSIVKEGQSVLDRTIKGFQRGVLRKKVKGIKDIDDETWQELYETGLALEQSVQERLEGLVGEGIHSPTARLLQQGFFKVNLLTQWTKAVQLASFTTGKRLITRNAELLAKGKGSKSKQEYLTQQLEDLGIKADDAVQWYKANTKDGVFNFDTAKQADFYKQDLTLGANRFVKEIILNPSTAEANRPLWFSTPAAQMLVQFAGYPTVFNNTILKRFAYEGKTSFMQSMPKAVPTLLLMTSVAHIGNLIRSNGNSVKDYETGLPKDDGEIIMDAVRRWGGFGPFDYAYRYGSESDRNVGQFSSVLKTFAGPLPQDAIDAILYRKGLAEVAVTNLPGYAVYDLVFGDGTRKELRRMARGTPAEKPKKPVLYAKGGIVTNVPNVHPEPDEVKMRGMDMTYNEMAGEILRDEEDV